MATQSSRTNLNWASELVGMMQQAGSHLNSPDIMLGEVVTAPPNLTIKVGDIVLYKEQLLVADYLLKDYKRAYFQEGKLSFTAERSDGTLSSTMTATKTPAASVPSTVVGDHGSHGHSTHEHPVHSHLGEYLEVHTTKDNFTAHGDGKDPVISDGSCDGTADEKYFWFKDTLKPKDLVLVQQLPNTHYFVVYNRLIRMEDVTSEVNE